MKRDFHGYYTLGAGTIVAVDKDNQGVVELLTEGVPVKFQVGRKQRKLHERII